MVLPHPQGPFSTANCLMQSGFVSSLGLRPHLMMTAAFALARPLCGGCQQARHFLFWLPPLSPRPRGPHHSCRGPFAWWSAAPLTPGGAFATVALLDAARLPMLLLPAAVTACINAHVSGRRLSAFLCVPDMDRTFYAASTERRDDVAVKPGARLPVLSNRHSARDFFLLSPDFPVFALYPRCRGGGGISDTPNNSKTPKNGARGGYCE